MVIPIAGGRTQSLVQRACMLAILSMPSPEFQPSLAFISNYVCNAKVIFTFLAFWTFLPCVRSQVVYYIGTLGSWPFGLCYLVNEDSDV